MVSRFVCPATYIVASRPLDVLYIGSTNDLPRRAYEHREGLLAEFTRDHGCNCLVWYEPHDLMTEAIRRERALKHWPKSWKLALIERENPDWRDLYLDLNK